MKHKLSKTGIGEAQFRKTKQLYSKNEGSLEHYLDFLMEWNEKINLVSRTVSRETVREHVIHSLVPVSMGIFDGIDVWIDAGSGGGLPGIPLAIALSKKKWILNDNVRKKMKAAKSMVSGLNLENVEVQAKSISLVRVPEKAGIVSKHAFKIPDLLRLLKGKNWEKIVMWKGAEAAEKEICQSRVALKASIYEFKLHNPFYEGKAIVEITRL